MGSLLKSLKGYWSEVPFTLKNFLKKALLLIIIWKLAYNLFLKPNRTIDESLTTVTTQATVGFLQLFHNTGELTWTNAKQMKNSEMSSASIYLNGKRSLGIADACNAMELMILYCGFIICMPTTFKRMFLFIVLGLLGIFMINILRCSAMFWFNLHNKEWFHFAHHYLFRIIVYTAIFGAWVWYCKKVNYND